MKKKYLSPTLEVSMIETEEGFAAGSAFVRPQDPNGVVQEEWEEDDDVNKTIDWNNW